MADIAQKFGFVSGGFMGIPMPAMAPGKLLFPQHVSLSDGAVSVTAARYYCFPIWIDKIQTFSGAKCSNFGTGDSGRKVKIAIYNEDGSLAKDFGEVTLTGATAIRTFASSWTPSRLGWHDLRIVSDSASTLYTVASTTQVSGAGYYTRTPTNGIFATFITSFGAGANYNQYGYACDYVDGTYANFPESTALAATGSLTGPTNAIPAVALYK